MRLPGLSFRVLDLDLCLGSRVLIRFGGGV